MNLEKLGLSPNESKIYLALLDLGSVQAGKISEKAGIHRRAAYDALNRLIEKGLVSFVIQNSTKYYQVSSPEKLKSFLKEKENQIKEQHKIIDEILPELLTRFSSKKSKLEAHIYRGKEGLKTVMSLILKENKDWLSIGSSGKGPEVLPYFLEHWHKQRVKQKIKLKSLVANTPDGRKRGLEFLEIGLAQIKILPKEIQNPQTIWIFGDKTAVILVSVEQPIILLIDNKEISQSFRGYFEQLWKNSKSP